VPVPPSGDQFQIVHGEHCATIVEVGGGVRQYRVGDRDVLQPYGEHAICDGAHGAPLMPWPNRLADGRFSFGGQTHQVPITEPEKHNAIHGLVRWRNWQAIERSGNRVLVATRLYPSDGWPFTLDLSIEYVLDDGGLTVETCARNITGGTCPFAAGQHPYLSPGPGAAVDDCTLELKAATRILTDPERQLPTGSEPVDGTDYDFRSPRPIGSLEIDYAFTDLERDAEGRAWMRLGCPDRRTVELWADESYKVLEVYTGDTLAPSRRRRGLGAEPMTCPPNALQTGESIVRLEDGETHVSRWGVRLA
jgi:aldose 1-epimerase